MKLSREKKAETGSGHIWGRCESRHCPGRWGQLLVAAGLRVPPQAHMFFLCPSFCVSSLSLLWPLGKMDFSHRENTQEIGPRDIHKSNLVPALSSLPGPRSCGNSSGPLRTGLAQFPASVRPLTLPSAHLNGPVPSVSRPCRCCSLRNALFSAPHPCSLSAPYHLLQEASSTPASCGRGGNCTSWDACPASLRVGLDST